MPTCNKNEPSFPCFNCGITVSVRRVGKKWFIPTKYCSRECSIIVHASNLRGRSRPKDGTGKGWIDASGYKRVSSKLGVEGAEHRQVMETILGRKLKKGETVHHKDGNKLNNNPNNLELWTKNHGYGIRAADLDIWSGTIPLYQREAL